MKGIKTIMVSALIVAILCSISFTGGTTGHSPGDINLDYDINNEQLNVTITHDVDDKDSHYIESVEIKKNGEDIDSVDYSSQPSTSTFTYTYQIKAEKGDKITVKAICNQYGDIENTVEITEKGAESTGGESPFLAPWILIVLTVFTVFIYERTRD